MVTDFFNHQNPYAAIFVKSKFYPPTIIYADGISIVKTLRLFKMIGFNASRFVFITGKFYLIDPADKHQFNVPGKPPFGFLTLIQSCQILIFYQYLHEELRINNYECRHVYIAYY